jgi:tRNA1(Val) A37 N6-methylase TrmN6
VNRILSEDGDFWLILPFQLQTYIQEIAGENQLYCKQLIQIHSKENNRNTSVVFQFQKKQSNLSITDFYIRNADNSYTEAYIQLTKSFHYVEL